MPIQPRRTLSGQDLQAALDHLGASVLSLARDSGVPRYNLGLLRSKGVPLSKAHDVALRQYLAEQGISIADDADERPPAQSGRRPVRFCWPIPDAVSDDDMQVVLGMVEDNDARIAALLKQRAEKTHPLFADPEFTSETVAALQELFALCAESYVLLRMLRGWRALGVDASPNEASTLRGVLLDTFRQRMEEAGFIAPELPPEEEEEPEEADT